MGWGEARRPAPPTRADLARELATALGETIPEHVTAEKAWPMLLERAGWAVKYTNGEDMGSPIRWPEPPADEGCDGDHLGPCSAT